MSLTLRQLRLLDLAPQEGAADFVACASGLALVNGRFYVVADDALELAVFAFAGSAPGTRLRLFSGALPADHAERKAKKPDLEALCVLPARSSWPHGALLAVPSGSTAARRTGALLALDADGAPSAARSARVDFGPLYARLAHTVPALNVEGAAVRGDALFLANRGNLQHPSALLELDFAAVARALEQRVPPGPAAFRRVAPLALGRAGDVPLAPTDLCALDDGTLLVCAAAEATASAYDDGSTVGAALFVLSPELAVVEQHALPQGLKPEGLWAWRECGAIELRLVCDADDPAVPSPLLAGRLS